MTSAALEEVADGVYAYLQRGSWGFSNAGLVTDSGESLLVDTLYDLRLTAQMLSEMRRATSAAERIGTVVNTHANGDHCWGNELVAGARIVASRAAAAEMLEVSPRLMAAFVKASRLVLRGGAPAAALLRLLGRVGVPRAAALADSAAFFVECFGPFEFGGISVTPPTSTFDGALDLTVGGKRVQLFEVGPAHTKGDVIVCLPEQRVAFTGDILFIGSHPVLWQGPVTNWVAACDRLLALPVDVIVPGHGPLTTKDGVRRTKEYWGELTRAVQGGRDAGASPDDITRDLFRRGFDGWTEKSRLAVNVDTIYRELAGDPSHPDPITMVAKMARLEALR